MAIKGQLPNALLTYDWLSWWQDGIHRALVLGLVLIAGTAIEQAPSVGPPDKEVRASYLIDFSCPP